MFTGEYDVRLADGRILRVQDTGHIGDPTVIFFHGMPPSPLQYESGLAVAAANLRLLAYDRPGYGGSTSKPDRTITDVATDVAAIADELDVEHFAVWGASGGGPYALACAALLADRVVAAAAAPTLAPYDAPGLDWFAGMAQMDVQRFKLAISGRDVLQPELASQAATFRAVDPAQFIELVGPVLSPPDRAILDTELATSLLDTVREMLTPGVEGWVEDLLALVAPWGVELGSVRGPVGMWHGQQDLSVPVAHGRWLANAIPGATLRVLPDDGHLSLIFGREGEVIDWLAEQLRRDH